MLRLLALALALVAAWPSAAEHPRRDYACLGSAPAGVSPASSLDVASGFTFFIHHVALPAPAEPPAVRTDPIPSVREDALAVHYRSRPGSSTSERGPPAAS
jgi:hypothetical protein